MLTGGRGSTAGTLIVGGSLAGFSVAEGLRARGNTDPITIIGAEPHLPYSRPALSKQVLSGVWTAEQAAITDPTRLADLGIALVSGVTAHRADLVARTVTSDAGEHAFDVLVAATGAAPRGLSAVPSARTIRTLDDVVALRAAFTKPLNETGHSETGHRETGHSEAGPRVVVLGAGVLGCELAAAAAEAGLDVTLVGRREQVVLGSLGGLLHPRPETLLEANGVRLLLGREATGSRSVVDGSLGRATIIELSDGTELTADLVIAAVGCEPAVGWLQGSGLDLSDGVLCDGVGRAAPGVFAVGDVARWMDADTGVAERVEHQSNAIEQAQSVAEFLVTGESASTGHAFFWTELFGTRIQALGSFPPGVSLAPVAGDPEGDRFVVAAQSGGVTHGIAGWNMARDFRLARTLLDAPHLADSRIGSPST